MSFPEKKGSQYIWDAIRGGLTSAQTDHKNIIITNVHAVTNDIPVR